MGRVKTELVDGRATTYAYDALGRETRRVTPTGAQTTYIYDAAGNRTRVTASGREINFSHDAAGRECERSVGGSPFSLTQLWDPAGRLAQQTVVGAAHRTAAR